MECTVLGSVSGCCCGMFRLRVLYDGAGLFSTYTKDAGTGGNIDPALVVGSYDDIDKYILSA